MKKKAVKMICEGSCLANLPSDGKLIDVSPDYWLKKENKENTTGWHSIYRNAIGYYLSF